MEIADVRNFIETMEGIAPGAFTLDEENKLLNIDYKQDKVQVPVEELINISMEPRKRYGVYVIFSATLPDDPEYTRFIIMKIAKNKLQQAYIFFEYIFKRFWYEYRDCLFYVVSFLVGFLFKGWIS